MASKRYAHTTEQYLAARDFAVAMGQDPLAAIGTFAIDSDSRPGLRYEMLHTPEGFAVHQGLGCEAELFKGPLACKHSRMFSISEEDREDMTTALALQNHSSELVPARIEFTSEQLEVIASTICVNGRGERAPEAFVQLFLGICRHTGLDPFLKQIYAMEVKGKWTAFTGVDGYRVIAERSGLFDGIDGPHYSTDGEHWSDVPKMGTEPFYCRVGVWRKGVPRPFVTILHIDQRYNETSDSWRKDPHGMLAKCCETLSHRKAFPADMAMLSDVRVDIEDPDGMPMSRAEVPVGEYRELTEAPQDVAPPTPPPPARKAPESAPARRTGTSRPAASPTLEEQAAQIAAERAQAPNVEPVGDELDPDDDEEDLQSILDAEADGTVELTDAEREELRLETLRKVEAILKEFKTSWDKDSYAAFFSGLSAFMPDGEARFKLMEMTLESAAECLNHLQEARDNQ